MSVDGLGGGQGILVHIAQVILAVILAGVPELPLGFVEVHLVVGHVDDAAGNVGAVVAGALQVCEDVRPDEAGNAGALPLLEPEYMCSTLPRDFSSAK